MENVQINQIASIARKSLENGSDTHFNRLVEVLFSHRRAWIATYAHRFPAIADSLESEYFVTLWRAVLAYDGSSDFLCKFNTALKRNAIDLLRKETRHTRRSDSLEKLAEDDHALSILPQVASAEDEYIDATDTSDRLEKLMDERGLGPYERAVVRHRWEHGTSLDEVVNLAPIMFRNKQQAWRKTVAALKHKPTIR